MDCYLEILTQKREAKQRCEGSGSLLPKTSLQDNDAWLRKMAMRSLWRTAARDSPRALENRVLFTLTSGNLLTGGFVLERLPVSW